LVRQESETEEHPSVAYDIANLGPDVSLLKGFGLRKPVVTRPDPRKGDMKKRASNVTFEQKVNAGFDVSGIGVIVEGIVSPWKHSSTTQHTFLSMAF